MHSAKLYPENSNGHPIAAGYNVIASAIAPEVEQYVNPIEDGYYNAKSQSGVEKLIYIEDGKYWFMENIEQLRLIKKPEGINTKKLAGLLYAGHLSVKNND
ncbi:MAG: hypothetical protein HOM24_04300 [Flavobacteriales bacterium]|nr:hypothetical protein [Flavobacteriales bacterium]